MKAKIILSAVSLILLINVQAIAGSPQDTDTAELITPTLFAVHIPGATANVTLNDAMFACNLTNVGNTVRTVEVRIISNGVILLNSGEISLAPEHTADYVVNGFPNGAPIYCDFTVEGWKKDYRGDAKLFHASGGSDIVVIAAE